MVAEVGSCENSCIPWLFYLLLIAPLSQRQNNWMQWKLKWNEVNDTLHLYSLRLCQARFYHLHLLPHSTGAGIMGSQISTLPLAYFSPNRFLLEPEELCNNSKPILSSNLTKCHSSITSVSFVQSFCEFAQCTTAKLIGWLSNDLLANETWRKW